MVVKSSVFAAYTRIRVTAPFEIRFNFEYDPQLNLNLFQRTLIFIAGQDQLIQLSPNLTVLRRIPITESDTNVNKVLLTYTAGSFTCVLTCGTFRGRCSLRDLSNISNVIYSTDDIISNRTGNKSNIDKKMPK